MVKTKYTLNPSKTTYDLGDIAEKLPVIDSFKIDIAVVPI